MGYDPLEPRPGALDMMVDSLVRLGDYYREGDEAAKIARTRPAPIGSIPRPPDTATRAPSSASGSCI
jgi:hypothetical protein